MVLLFALSAAVPASPRAGPAQTPPTPTAAGKAASPPRHSIPWDSIDGGAGALSAGALRLEGSIGQWDVDPGLCCAFDDARLATGFWTSRAQRQTSVFSNGFESP